MSAVTKEEAVKFAINPESNCAAQAGAEVVLFHVSPSRCEMSGRHLTLELSRAGGRGSNELLVPDGFNNDRSAVAEDLGEARHDLSRVITHSNDAIRTKPARVLQHLLIGFAACLLAKFRVDGDVAPE
jgi:hypothetical protein